MLLCAASLPGSPPALASDGGKHDAPRPNIVVILADDLGQGDLGSYNHRSAIPTPNMDRLAREGMRFTDMHSPSAVCTPTRYSLLTGRYAWRSRLKSEVLWGYDPMLIEEGRLTLPAMLKSVGYSTAAVGKWHLGLGDGTTTDYGRPLRPGPTDRGFDSFYGIPASLDMDPYVYVEDGRTKAAPSTKVTESTIPRGVFWRGGAAAPEFKFDQVLADLTARAVDIVKTKASETQPYFMYFALTSPHTPWVPRDAYRNTSRAGLYGDFVNETDAMIGQVLEAIDKSGERDNTIVIVTSDNGADWSIDDQQRYPHRANMSWRGRKADIYEAGHRVPFIIRWPRKVAAGSVSPVMTSLVDMMATIAAITGQTLPPDAAEDSFNILPTIQKGSKLPVRQSLVMHSKDGMFAIREGKWKLILGLGSGGFTLPVRVEPDKNGITGQLYDLDADPGETQNLFEANPEVVRRLTSLLDMQRESGRTRPSR